jgi:preprotein translocase subunit SecD
VRRQVTLLVGTLTVVAASLIAVVSAGLTPVLGLDLQGGISVVLAPSGNYNRDTLDVAVDIIRSRVDALGVAEPEISRQGDNIVVDLPGVNDRDKARRIVGRTGELQFRPALEALPREGSSQPGGDVETTPPGRAKARQEVVLPTVPDGEAQTPARYRLGPACGQPDCSTGTFTGADVSGASREFQGNQYTIQLELKDSGQEQINEMAERLYPLQSQPPRGQMAIVLDGIVQSAPSFQQPNFPENTVSITGDFTGGEADDLARLLRYGALPVHLEELTTQDVSPTLGQDQLQAGIAAGIIGIILVALYMVIYYRLLGLVVIGGLAVTAAATYALVCWLGETVGLALTLAGVTGLIVSVGVTVDSYVVYFERLKDEVRTGTTVRSSVDRGFTQAFRTILAADLVSLIGAGILYLLAIGSVRGFAFFLGLATLIDLIISYTFMHPLVTLMARRPGLVRMPFVGIGAGLDVKGATA